MLDWLAQILGWQPRITYPQYYRDKLKELSVQIHNPDYSFSLDPTNNERMKFLSYRKSPALYETKTKDPVEDLVIGIEVNLEEATYDNWCDLIIDLAYRAGPGHWDTGEHWWAWTCGSGLWTGDLLLNGKVMWSYAAKDPFKKVIVG